MKVRRKGVVENVVPGGARWRELQAEKAKRDKPAKLPPEKPGE